MIKLLLLYGISVLITWGICDQNISSTPSTKKVVIQKLDSISFNADVQPILVKNCSPCHFPGGKMYARMPFDKDTTIINHQAGILKRIKGKENTVIKDFIEQNKNGLPVDKPSVSSSK